MTREEMLAQLRKAREPKPKKGKKPIARESAKTIAKKKEEKKTPDVSKVALAKWFYDIAEKHWQLPVCACMECESSIPAQFSKHATAHLLPKKLFKSVATHPLNYMILGAGCGCHEKTHRIDKIVTLKVWPEIARRMKIMIKGLPFDELKHISTELHEALDNTD